MATSVEKVPSRCDARKVKPGSVFSRHSHGTVLAVQPTARGSAYSMRNEYGFEWVIQGSDILENEFSFADQHEDEAKESRTKIIEVLTDNVRTAMTICFKKKPDFKHISKVLADGKGSLSDRAWDKKVKDLCEGDERVMVGYSTGQFDEHQRLKFIEQGAGPRLVDTRTIQWMIVGRVKHIVK